MEDFVPYELAVKLVEKGFNYETRDIYERNTLACRYEDVPKPTISQVFVWLREEKKIFVAINIGYCYEPFLTNPKMEPILKGYYYGIWELDNLNDKNALSEYFEAPELAALAAVNYIIDNNLI